MALRKASSYSSFSARPYTRRSAVQNRSYIKAVPAQKVVRFEMGDIQGWTAGKYKNLLRIRTMENVQIRDTALESARQCMHKILDTKLPEQYYLTVKVFPHHVLRENKMITGAGADRMQTGMSQSFGRTIGRAALVKAGADVFLIAVADQRQLKIVREAVRQAKAKLPFAVHVLTEFA